MKTLLTFSLILIGLLVLNSCEPSKNSRIIYHQKFYINNPMPLGVQFGAKGNVYSIDTFLIPAYQRKLVYVDDNLGGERAGDYNSLSLNFSSLFLKYDTTVVSSNFWQKIRPHFATTYERSGEERFYDVEVFTLTIDTLIFK